MRFLRHIGIIFLLASCAVAAEPADIIMTNARVYTFEQKQPWAEAVAIRGKKIIAVGAAKKIAAFKGPKTRLIDAQQHLVLPGFTDSHIHFIDGSFSLLRVNVEDTKNLAEIQKM